MGGNTRVGAGQAWKEKEGEQVDGKGGRKKKGYTIYLLMYLLRSGERYIVHW